MVFTSGPGHSDAAGSSGEGVLWRGLSGDGKLVIVAEGMDCGRGATRALQATVNVREPIIAIQIESSDPLMQSIVVEYIIDIEWVLDLLLG